jgi:alkaline phosphatase D
MMLRNPFFVVTSVAATTRAWAWVFAVMVLIAFGTARAEAADEKIISRIGFGSCAHQDRPQPIWEAVLASKPDVFLLIGDNIYGDTRDMAVLRKKYAQEAAVPGLIKLRAAVPVLGTWDDHDFGENDAGADYPFKRQSQQLFLDFFQVPADSPRRTQEGIYSAQTFGPPGKRVQIILLDTRYFRSRLARRPATSATSATAATPQRRVYVGNDDPNVTMLGEAQWRWLGEQLRQPAELRLLVSSIQLVSEDHSAEKWMNFPRERQRLFALIRQTRAHGIVVLSGDRHFADLSMMDAGIGYPIYDLTSSGLTQGAAKWRPLQENSHRVAGMSYGDNFGLVQIDWSRPDPLVSLQVRDGEGDVRIHEKIPLSVLRPAAPPAATTAPTTARAAAN